MKPPYSVSSEPWHHSVAEDYAKAHDDFERRAMLSRFGVDPAHQVEADRLFPKYAEYKRRQIENKHHPVKNRVRRTLLRFKHFFLKLEKSLALPVRIAEMFLAVYGVCEAVCHVFRFFASYLGG